MKMCIHLRQLRPYQKLKVDQVKWSDEVWWFLQLLINQIITKEFAFYFAFYSNSHSKQF